MTTSNQDVNKIIDENEWMIRPCHNYYEEYSDCTSIKARFHQYFIFGEMLDCSQWKTDYNNCCRFKEDEDKKSGVKLIESELIRRKQRLDAHNNNNIWEKRLKPPEDWDKPVPEWMQKKHDVSYLALKSKELKDGKVTDDIFANRTFCAIM